MGVQHRIQTASFSRPSYHPPTHLPNQYTKGWTITLKFDKSITMIQNLEADLLEQNADNTTLVFGPKVCQ